MIVLNYNCRINIYRQYNMAPELDEQTANTMKQVFILH